jgi:NAD(P)-dependent dehydrogenase (short-subunit alcohol dehydrogenase family)
MPDVILAGGSGGLGSETARLLSGGDFRLIVSYRANAERAAKPSPRIAYDCSMRRKTFMGWWSSRATRRAYRIRRRWKPRCGSLTT